MARTPITPLYCPPRPQPGAHLFLLQLQGGVRPQRVHLLPCRGRLVRRLQRLEQLLRRHRGAAHARLAAATGRAHCCVQPLLQKAAVQQPQLLQPRPRLAHTLPLPLLAHTLPLVAAAPAAAAVLTGSSCLVGSSSGDGALVALHGDLQEAAVAIGGREIRGVARMARQDIDRFGVLAVRGARYVEAWPLAVSNGAHT
jgi:hypothetical protein